MRVGPPCDTQGGTAALQHHGMCWTWLFGGTSAVRDVADDADAGGFVCSTCGRTDLAEAGDWDPPICEECDAAINFDAEMESQNL
jgi:hypothetical protein